MSSFSTDDERHSLYESAPWMAPIPVRSSNLASIDGARSSFNVETDLAAIETFGWSRSCRRRVLHADLQCNADVNPVRRLGSGRAGVYRGHYLKGVGRTLLAANWNDPNDVYHASGHLTASGGVREYIASCYLEACGVRSSITPCVGLLLGPLPHKFVTAYRPQRSRPYPPVDRRYRALTVKRADFARLSNLLWLVFHNHAEHGFVRTFSEWFMKAFTPPDAKATSAESTPAALVVALRRSIARAIGNFELFVRHGVFWGSFHNNFTADGRFMDLELAVLSMGPFAGTLVLNRTKEDTMELQVGTEVMDYLRQVRRWIEAVVARLEQLIRSRTIYDSRERAFAAELISEMRAAFPRTHCVFSSAEASVVAADLVARAYDVRGSKREGLRRSLLRQFARSAEAPRGRASVIGNGDALYLTLAEGLRGRGIPWKGLPTRAFVDGARIVNDALLKIDEATELGTLVNRVRDLELVVREVARPKALT